MLVTSESNSGTPRRTLSILDSPTQARVERARLRLEASRSGQREDSLERSILDPKIPFNESIDPMVECIRTVTDFAFNIEHLCIEVNTNSTRRFEQICGYLKVLCDRDDFKSLHLEFGIAEAFKRCAYRMVNLKQLTTITFYGAACPDVIKALRPLVHLKRLVFWDCDWDTGTLVNASPITALPQIEELTIEIRRSQLLSFLMQVARHWVNLKKVTAICYGNIDPAFPVAELNRARMKLENACELTIFSDYKGATTLDYGLVKLKGLEVLNLQQCMLSNE